MMPTNLDHDGCGGHSSMACLGYLLSEARHKLDRYIVRSNLYPDGCGDHSKKLSLQTLSPDKENGPTPV